MHLGFDNIGALATASPCAGGALTQPMDPSEVSTLLDALAAYRRERALARCVPKPFLI